jgi:DNA repair exonuclease SbcCD ATPase subunit
MIIFECIRYKNLLSSGNYWTEIQLNSNKNSLIIGENGAGKSTVLDALCFALFGKPFRSVNKGQLVNSINQKDCVVELEFSTNGKRYKIVRGIKPNVFQIFQDGNLLNQESTMKDYQEVLEKTILKFNFKSFTQIVILGSASFVPFMQLSAGDRRAIIEDLLDIQIFSTMNTIIKDKVSNNKDLLSSVKNEIELLKQKYELEKKHIEALKQNNNEKIEKYKEEIKKYNESIEKLLKDNETNTTLLSEYQEKISDKSSVETKIKEINKIESKIENNLSRLETDSAFFTENDNCPTCRQKIDDDFKKEELKKLDSKIKESREGLKKIEEKIQEQQHKLDDILVALKKAQALQVKISSNNTAINETNKYITKLNKEIEELNETKTLRVEDENTLVDLQKELKEKQNHLKSLIEEKEYYDVASSLLKDNGIKTKIIKQYLPVINKLVNKYLSALEFFVNFNLDESFKETIKSRHRDEFTYNNFSEGEKQRIDMSLMLTWRAIAKLKNSTNTNLLFLDEIFDSSLDTNGTEYLMNILHMLEDVNLFVISHKGDILYEKFDDVIKFEKVKNFSRIVK